MVLTELEFGEQLHERIKNLIPKMASAYRKLEAVVTQRIEDEAVLLATAKHLDDNFEAFNKVKDACDRMIPKDKGKHARKVKD